MRFMLPILGGLSLTLAGAQDSPSPAAPAEQTLRLPPGAAARAWSLVGPETQPKPLPKEWLTQLENNPWARPETFGLWAKAVKDAQGEGPTEQTARAFLALLSARNQRPKSAWRHVASLSDEAGWICALVPRLFPGVPLDHPIQAGGVPAPLIRGTRLNPIAPPRDPAIPAWAQAPRKATIENLFIEDSAIDLTLDISGGGIELLLSLRSGPATAVACSTPFVPGFVVRHEYLDFESQEPIGALHLLVLSPTDEEPRSLYSRLTQDKLMLPTAPDNEKELSQSMRNLGMVLLVTGKPDPRLTAAAQAFEDLLGVPVSLAPQGHAPHDGRKRIDLSDPTRSEALLRFLIGAIEERLLRS